MALPALMSLRFSEVIEGRGVGGKGLGLLREFGLFQEPSHSCSHRSVSIAGLWQYGNAIIQRTEFSLFPLTTGGGILGIFADRQANALAFLLPLKVVGSFGMTLGTAVYDDDIGADSAV